MAKHYPYRVWITQFPVDYVDTTLTINDWQNVIADLSGGDPCRLWYIVVEQTNNGAAAEDIELEISYVDAAGASQTDVVDLAGVASAAQNYVFNDSFAGAGTTLTLIDAATAITTNAIDADHAMPLILQSVGLIRTRQTTAVDGVSASIEVNIVWDKLVEV